MTRWTQAATLSALALATAHPSARAQSALPRPATELRPSTEPILSIGMGEEGVEPGELFRELLSLGREGAHPAVTQGGVDRYVGDWALVRMRDDPGVQRVEVRGVISWDQENGTVSGRQCDPHSEDVDTRDFADAFAPSQPLVFPTAGPSPVLSVRSLSVSPSGHLLLTDSRSFDLKLADGAGRIIRVLGGEGEGPGEFTGLFDAAFLSDDRIVALDGGRVLATLFDSAGEVLNTIPLREHLDPRAVVAVDDSTFLIAGLVGSPGGGNHMARIYSLDGSHTESFLPADQLLFETRMIVDGAWGVALPGGSLALGLDVTPAVHLFSETGSHICTQASEPPQWSQLPPRDEPVAPDQATREWIQQATVTVGAAYAGGSLFRQYRSSGENGVSLLAEYDDSLNLRNVYTSLPGRLVGGDGETLFFLGDETVDETRVLRFRATGRESGRPAGPRGRFQRDPDRALDWYDIGDLRLEP